MAEIPEKDEKFGEKVELPSSYELFWREYQQGLTDGELGEYSQGYFSIRINFLLQEESIVKEGSRDRLVLTRKLPTVPTIQDTYIFHWNRDNVYGEPTIHTSGKRETIISLQPTIETALYADEISRYRKISPKLEEITCFTWLNGNTVGNPSKVGILLDLFDDYYASREKSWQEHRVQGNELLSIPSTYPIEEEIAQLYEKIGRNKFDALTEKYFDLRKTIFNARKIDPNAIAGLEKSVQEQYEVMRKEILAQL